MSVFKQIGGGNHVAEPFEVNANHSFTWLSGSAAAGTNGQSSPTSSLSGSGFSINLANEPPINYPTGTTQFLGGISDGGFHSYPLFNSVKKYFYVGEASASSNNAYGFYPSGSMFVWNVGSNFTGEGIKPDTFKIELAGSSINIQDDGTGKLKLNKTGSVVGNISYNHGIATVQRNITASATSFISADGISIRNNVVVTSTFQSIVNIYEHTVTCKIQPSEYNVTFNPTAYTTVNSLDGLGVGNYNNYIDSGSVLPYVTTLGLYNDSNEMLAVAKLSKPITRMKHSDQTFVIKFDE